MFSWGDTAHTLILGLGPKMQSGFWEPWGLGHPQVFAWCSQIKLSTTAGAPPPSGLWGCLVMVLAPQGWGSRIDRHRGGFALLPSSLGGQPWSCRLYLHFNAERGELSKKKKNPTRTNPRKPNKTKQCSSLRIILNARNFTLKYFQRSGLGFSVCLFCFLLQNKNFA